MHRAAFVRAFQFQGVIAAKSDLGGVTSDFPGYEQACCGSPARMGLAPECSLVFREVYYPIKAKALRGYMGAPP
jgi:hypothetical protein